MNKWAIFGYEIINDKFIIIISKEKNEKPKGFPSKTFFESKDKKEALEVFKGLVNAGYKDRTKEVFGNVRTK